MPVYIRRLETLVPSNAYTQDFARERMMAWVEGDKERRLVNRVYRNSGIDTRHSVLADFQPSSQDALFKTGPDGKLAEPSTRERNERFVGEARPLCVEVARRAIEHCPGVTPADVTHVITVTCTGFSSPGPDYHIARELDLSPSTQRYALGFMGCYASLPALRMAAQFCQADPAAVVLVVSVELCSLHLRFSGGVDSLLGNAIFADGAAAAVVSARPPATGEAGLRLDGFASTLIPQAEKEMAWRIGNEGFEITLSTYVPDIIAANVRSITESVLQSHGLGVADIGRWAIHPGGKAIVDKIQGELALTDTQVHASREVLRQYGNMSSATSLFVMKHVMETAYGDGGAERVCAMAFGPGLTVETALLGVLPGADRP